MEHCYKCVLKTHLHWTHIMATRTLKSSVYCEKTRWNFDKVAIACWVIRTHTHAIQPRNVPQQLILDKPLAYWTSHTIRSWFCGKLVVLRRIQKKMAPTMSVARMVVRPRLTTTTNLLYLVRPFTIHSNSNYHRGSHSTNRVEYRAAATITSERERARTVAAYYNQPAVEAAAKKVQTDVVGKCHVDTRVM